MTVLQKHLCREWFRTRVQVVDLFDDFAGSSRELDHDGLRKLLASIGEWPSEETLNELFRLADSDESVRAYHT